MEIVGWGRFIYPYQRLFIQVSIDLRSGSGAFGAVVETVFALRSTLSDGQLPEISTVRPVRSYTNQAAGFHRQSVALQALRGSSPVKSKKCTKCGAYYHEEGIECGYRFCPYCGRRYSVVYIRQLEKEMYG